MDVELCSVSAAMAVLLIKFLCIVRLLLCRLCTLKLILHVVLYGCETWSLDIK